MRAVLGAVLAGATLIATAAPTVADPPPGGDTNPPNIHLDLPPSPWQGWYPGPVTVTLSANDGAGVEYFSYRLTGAQSGGEEAETGPFVVTIDQPGQTTIELEARDVNGNVATRRYGVGLDLADPLLTVGGTLVPGAVLNRGDLRYLDYGCADAGTGLSSCAATLDGRPYSSGAAVDTSNTGTHTIGLTAVDRVGRTTQRTITYQVRVRPLTVISPPRLVGDPTQARVGVPLTATGAVFEPTPGYFIYHWYVDGVKVSDGDTFTPREQDRGKSVSVSAFGSLAGPDYDQTETAQVGHLVVQQGQLRMSRAPGIDGAPTAVYAGEELRATPATFLPPAAAVVYRWYADDQQVGVGTSYIPGPGDVGRRISLTATGTHPDFLELTTERTPAVPVLANQFDLVAPPQVTGQVRVGQLLTITGAEVVPTAQNVQNLWKIGSQTVETDAPRLTLTSAHAGLRLSCMQVFTKPGFDELRTPCTFPGGATEVAVPVVTQPEPNPDPQPGWRLLGRATISGKPVTGRTLRAVPPRTSKPASRWRYQWLRNGRVIRGATAASYRVRRADRGDRIAVRVKAFAPKLPVLTTISKARRVRR